MKKLLIGASLLLMGLPVMAQEKELTFAVLNDKAGAQVAAITVSVSGC